MLVYSTCKSISDLLLETYMKLFIVYLFHSVALKGAVFALVELLQPSRFVCEKYVRKCKGAVKMCMTVLNIGFTCK